MPYIYFSYQLLIFSLKVKGRLGFTVTDSGTLVVSIQYKIGKEQLLYLKGQ